MHDQRLEAGARTFDDVRVAISELKDEIRGPRPQWWVLAALGISFVGTLVSIVVQLTR